jgi:hypothetical protein
MSPKACRVSFTDPNGVDHSVEMLADSLYEADGLGLSLLKKDGWVKQEPAPLTRILEEVREPATEHSLTLQQLRKWTQSSATSPADRISKR